MYCIDAQNNTRSVAPDYVALDGEILCAELPGAVLQSVASIEAKAALMDRNDLPEEEAFTFIQQTAMQNRARMRDVAQQIVDGTLTP